MKELSKKDKAKIGEGEAILRSNHKGDTVVKEFLNSALEAGWRPEPDEKLQDGNIATAGISIDEILLNPEIWHAVGITRKWGSFICESTSCPKQTHGVWQENMHQMVEGIIRGLSQEEALKRAING